MEVAGDDVGFLVVLRIFRVWRPVLFLTGRIEELKRQLARVGQILLGHLFERLEIAHRHVVVERKDEVAEEHVGAGVDERLRHAEAIERADHEHALAAQVDAELVLQKPHRRALERILQAAAVDDGRRFRRLEQAQAVAQRVAMTAGVEIDVDSAQADGIDRAVEFAHHRDRLVELAVGASSRDVEGFAQQLRLRAVIARRRTQRYRDDRFHATAPARRRVAAAARIEAIRSDVIAASKARMSANRNPQRSAIACISTILARSIPRPSV